jgi:hypothetical protein
MQFKEGYVPYPFRRIYVGDSNYNRFRAISEHGLKSLRYTDLFSDETREELKAGPSRNTRDSRTRHQQRQIPVLENQALKHQQTGINLSR